MIEDQDIPLPGSKPDVSPSSTSSQEPMVVIHYRERLFPSMLIPPALILLAAALIVSYRVQTPDWPGLAALRAHALAPAPAVRAEEAPSGPAAAPAPIVVVEQSNPRLSTPQRTTEGEPPPRAEPAAQGQTEQASTQQENDASPDEPDAAHKATKPVPAIGFDPPGTVAKLQAETREVWDDIQREAQQRKAKLLDLEDKKPLLLEQDMREAPLRRADQLALAKRTAEEDRPRFWADLRRILKQRGEAAGPDIEALCEDYGKDVLPDIELEARWDLNGPSARLTRAEKVNVLRSHGLPETRVLFYLWHEEAKNIAARDGPRNEDEALVWAARQLLSIRPQATRPALRPAAGVARTKAAARPESVRNRRSP